jgi:predicted RNA binding protein YcfA (HicA-like mRNA interferase family)
MPRLRRCSGAALVALLQPLGFAVERQRGSHLKLVRSTPSGRQILVVPNHSLLDTGTIRAIARQAATYLTDEEIRHVFYTE